MKFQTRLCAGCPESQGNSFFSSFSVPRRLAIDFCFFDSIFQFIESQRARIEHNRKKENPKKSQKPQVYPDFDDFPPFETPSEGSGSHPRKSHPRKSHSPVKPAQSPAQTQREDYALLSDQSESEIFELPLTPEGHLLLQVVSFNN